MWDSNPPTPVGAVPRHLVEAPGGHRTHDLQLTKLALYYWATGAFEAAGGIRTHDYLLGRQRLYC